MKTIRLPTGEEYTVKELVNRTSNLTTYNLRYGTIRTKSAAVKYTLEERIWQAKATPELIAAKYSISIAKAKGIMYQARYALGKLDIDYKTK